MSSTNNKHYFLTGGGEMGELIRSKDWSKTSLGTPDAWPQSLRTTLSIILNSKFPMFLWWGEELTCFYNDAYRPSLGKEGKHPVILGQKAEEAWSEIWPTIHPLIKQVLAGEGATWSENQLIPIYRNGKLEDVYWTFSYSSVFDESEKIAGVLVICNETTENVTSIKKLEESNNRFLNNIIQAPTAMCVFRGKNHVVEIANDMMLEIWGKSKEEVINKPIFEGLPEAKGQGLEILLDKVYETGEKFTANERPVQLPRKGKIETTYVNFVYEALKETNGTISGIVVIAIEVTTQVISRSKIEESEHKVRALVENAPFPIAVYVGKEMIVELANESIISIWGKGHDVIGKSFKDVLPELDNQLVFEQIKTVLETGQSFHTKNTPLDLIVDGELYTYYFNYSLTPLYDIKGNVYGVMNTGVDLTDLNLAKKKIEESEQRLNIIVEASELGTWELNAKTKELKYSMRYLEIIGGYKDYIELTHEQLVKHIHRDDLPIREKAFEEAIISGFLHYEARIIWNDQSIHWVEAKGKIFYDADHKPDKLLGTARDITALKKHQQELEESEQKFRLLASSMPQHIWTSDTDGNLNYYNQSVYTYSGLTPEQINEEGWLQIVHPDDREENMKVWMDSIATGKDFLFEHRFKRHDGKYRWQLSRATPQIDENGKIQMWVGTSTDIQDQKTFTSELEKQVKERTKELSQINESLEKSEERYHLMVEEVQDYAILLLNHLGIVENWNLGAQKINGYKAEEIIGKDFSVFYTESDKESGLPQKLLKRAIQEGKAVQEGWRIRKNGSLFWANVVITAVRNKKKEIIGFSKVTHDLTEKKKADDKLKLNGLELQQKNIELEKMNKELQSFAYISSHDLQEPLRKIQTFASLIMEKESHNLSDSGKDKFKRMQNAAQRMQALINDLLSYSRTNIQEIKFEKTDLNQIIKEVKEDLREELEQKNAVIENDEICDEISIDIIPFQFRQLIYNLISNSIKFSKPDTPLHIKIKCEIAKGDTFSNDKLSAETEYCHIGISDNGIGFEQQYGEKIFEVFQRLHGRSEYAGTGIGLAILKKIVENHNGIINAEGKYNKGATFDVYIPLIKD